MNYRSRTLAGLSGLLIGVLCGVASGQQQNVSGSYPASNGWIPVGSQTGTTASPTTSTGPVSTTVTGSPTTPRSDQIPSTQVVPVGAPTSGAVTSTGYTTPVTATTGVRQTSYTPAVGVQNRVNQQFGLPVVQLANRTSYEQIPAPEPLDSPYVQGYPPVYSQMASGTAPALSQTGYATPMSHQSVYPGGSQYVEYTDAAPNYASGIANAYNGGNYATTTSYTGNGYGSYGNCAPTVCGDVGCTTGCDTGCTTYGGYGNYGMYGGVGTTGCDPGYLDVINPLRGLPCVFSASVGVETFRSPLDGPRSANIGFREVANLGGPLFPGYGLGYQIGVAGWQGNFNGNSSPFGGDEGERSQLFFTTGLFRRNAYQGFQFGFVWDYMKDEYFNDLEMNAVRAELGFRVDPRFDFGYYGLYNTGNSVYVLDSGNSGDYELTTLHTAYLRWTFENNATARINGGASADGDGYVSGSIAVPVGERLALDTQCYALFPDEKTNGWG
ncbi:MAG: hypothetical protein Q4C47_09485, partial [Planctomycetia bacterium]|nr:hypothetical protein [Planctomycetia bacterium]